MASRCRCTLLRDVGALIVDIHGQHEFQSLTRTAAQRELLDDFGKNIELADSVREAHKIWIALVNRTVELEGKARDRDSRIELLRFQVSELKALDLKEGEVAQLAEERTRHSNRGRLAEAAQAAVGLLYDSDEGNAHATASRALAGIKTPVERRSSGSPRSFRWSTRPPSRSAKRRASCRATSKPSTSIRRARKKSNGASPPSKN